MRKLLVLSLLGLLICVSLGSADLVTPRERLEDERIMAQGIRAYTATYKANESAVIVGSGNWRTALGLYVFDSAGNCVAKDDFSQPKTSDDLFALWVPSEQTRYSVEVHNAGIDVNTFQLALR